MSEKRRSGFLAIAIAIVAIVGVAAEKLVGADLTPPDGRGSTSLETGARAPAATVPGRIVRVLDGDTVDVATRSGTQDVRLLAIDSPEKFATRYGTPNECGAARASHFMEQFRGARVLLQADPSQDGVDRYGRLLRYVSLKGGADLGAREVASGLAAPYVYDAPARRYEPYRRLAVRARAAGRGSWSECAGDFHSAVPGIQNGL
jgi:endonuclease YncB( thermonuclease family)